MSNPSAIHNSSSEQQQENNLSMMEVVFLCLANWKWFVVSLLLCLGIALFYTLKTMPVYQRTASILIQDESKGKSVGSDVASMFSEMGLANGHSNVKNELCAIQSPAVLLEVGKRLYYDIDYRIPGKFHDQVLYDKTLPLEIFFHDLKPEQSAALVINLIDTGRVELSEFRLSGEDDIGESPVVCRLNAKTRTPVGEVTIVPAQTFNEWVETPLPISVSRTNLYSMTNAMQASLKAEVTSKEATVIDITYSDVVPQRAEDVINKIIEVYRERWMNDKNLMTIATSDFITERLGVIEQELGDVDQDISTYKSDNLLPDVETASTLHMEQSKENANRSLKLSAQRSICLYMRQQLIESSNQNQTLLVNSGVESDAIEKQISEYNNTLLERNSLVHNSSETNPLVKDLDRQLASLRPAILTGINNLIVSIDTQIAQLQKSENYTTSQIASSPDHAKYLQSVGRQQKVKETLYLFLLQKREENELSRAFTAYNTRIITPPTGSLQPVAPGKKKIMLIAFLFGLAIPVSLIYLRESTNTKVRGRKDLEKLTIPFLGEIPCYVSRKRRHWWQKRQTAERNELVVKPGKRDIVNEAFRVLRTNIEFVANNESGSANVILLTSFNADSGKSFLSVNIAKSFAIRNKHVLVIDCDLRRGTASKYVGSPGKGLSDYLSGKAHDLQELVVTDGSEAGMSVLPMGTMPPNPTELLYSERLAPMMDSLRRQYDYIFIDCPPIEIVADTQILERYADRVIFVVRAGLFERSMVPELQKLYDEKKYRNMSIVLNSTQGSSDHYGKYGNYRYGYGYGYGYGYHYGNNKKNKS